MEVKFPKLFEPGRIGTMELRNRITMPPMGSCLATDTGGLAESSSIIWQPGPGVEPL